MLITSLELTDYRNYRGEHKLEFVPNVNILLGDNAQGKTNILESIYLVATTRSHRTSKNRDLINFEASNSNIFIRSSNRNGENYFNLQVKEDNNKAIYINGKQIKKSSDILGYINVVLFSPEDLIIVTGSPGDRRRFLDIFISQVKPRYAVILNEYNKILKQRNQTLKDISQKKQDETLLDVWDEQLCEHASIIVSDRLNAVASLEINANKLYTKISDNVDNLKLNYDSQIITKNLNDYKNQLIDKLKGSRSRDIIYGSTGYGPHRDDLEIFVNNNSAKLFASQGQKRLVSLALKFSEVEYFKEKTNEYPVLLFDDVLLELDLSRKHNLLNEMLSKAQMIITTTDLKRYREVIISEAKIFNITKGSIKTSNEK